MKRGILVICDREEAYASRLMDYINRKEHFFEIHIFTTTEALLSHTSVREADILLIEEELWEDRIAKQAGGNIILLSEGRQVREDSPYPVVYKLQSAENIEKEVMSCYTKEGKQLFPEKTGNRHLELLGVFSPAGGSGKTTFALALGNYLAREKRVLYLNFESFGGLIGGTGFKGGMTDLLYYIKERKKNLPVLLSALIEQQQDLDCIFPVDYYGDLLSIKEEDIDFLLSEMEKSQYEVLVFDIGCMVPGIFYLLSKCSRVFVPRLSREEAGNKMAALERCMRIEEREELLLRMEPILVPKAQGAEMEQLIWQLVKNG